MIKTIFKKLVGIFQSKKKEPNKNEESHALECAPESIVFNEHTLSYYKRHVKGNGNISTELANKKITRNKELAFIYRKDDDSKKNPRVWYSYGMLRFMVQDGEVRWMENHRKKFPMWYKDWDKYNALNTYLQIEDGHVKSK